MSVIFDLGVALSVALRSNKAWPLAYCAIVLASVLTVFAQVVHPVSRWAYITALFAWCYLECLILVAGAWRAGRARRAVLAQGSDGQRP